MGIAPDTSVLARVHRPRNQVEADEARRELKRDELFFMQLALACRQHLREQTPSNVRCIEPLSDIGQYFPFTLTAGQMQAVRDILADMGSGRAMNRLLQADVGAGKTVVAAWAAIVAAMNGAQVAILCPTEILARQHYETIRGYFERAGVSVALITGSTPCNDARCPTANIVVGTTALLDTKIGFYWSSLGLVIVDEQHKFGVEQRAALRKHGNPHVLVMTATPIPRTMAMTVFGDLDVSVIRSMPPGRKPVKTTWCRQNHDIANIAHQAIWQELIDGHQVYVVCPRIEALDDEMRAVEEVYDEYRALFPFAGVDMLHGKMSPLDRGFVIKAWNECRTGILVSTTVIEVGVDNPNATVMVIEGAERFGLAQLHQLRGRVGRGKDQSYCFLLSDTDSAEARSRLRAMERTNDGFEIAEQDLKLRGPGDLLSTRQHGLPELKIASLIDDYDLLCGVRKEARELVARGPLPIDIQTELCKRYGDKIYLGDAG